MEVDKINPNPSKQIAVALVKEVGQDLEHCQTLMKKFNDFEKASYFMYINTCTCSSVDQIHVYVYSTCTRYN